MYVKCDPEIIDRFLHDPSNVSKLEVIEHLDACEYCRIYLDNQVANDIEWRRAGKMLQPGDFDDVSPPEYAAGGATTTAFPVSPSVKDVLDALSPTENPERLGRIGVYEVSGVIGIGGMGVVLKAIEPALDRVVAIKVLSPNLAGSDKARRRFAREARAAAAVLHPNVIPIHSVSNEEGLSYLVMAYVPGGSLQKRLDEQGSFSLQEILRIGTQIANGLAASHSQGLVHRDIKPANVLLEGDVDRVTITDFGLARAVDDNSLTQVGTIAGTPMYMSPEQARGEQVDHLSDLFSLGSVLFALCTGQPPFRADTSYGVMRKIIHESPTPIRDINPDIPDWLESIIQKLMSRDKLDRFESADEIHCLLERCLSHVQQPNTVPLPERLQLIQRNSQSVKQKLAIASLIIIPLLSIAYFFTTWDGIKSNPIANGGPTESANQSVGEDRDTGDPDNVQASATNNDIATEKSLSDLPQSEIVWMIEELVGDDMGLPKNPMMPTQDLVNGMEQLLDRIPSSREALAKKAVDAGKPEIAKVLLAGARVDAAASEAMNLAKMLVDAGNEEDALDAYLDAFRREPILFRREATIALFAKYDRLADLAEVFDENRLSKTRGITILLNLLESLMKGDLAATSGIPFLERFWTARPDARPFFNNTTFWEKRSKRRHDLLRARWLPRTFNKEDKGWDHLCRIGVDSGWHNWLEPLILNDSTMQPLIDQVNAKLKAHPHWAAGNALLAILESRNGNLEVAKKWVAQNIALQSRQLEQSHPDFVSAAHIKVIVTLIKGDDSELDVLVDELIGTTLETVGESNND